MRAVDIFSGAGGLAFGIARSGFSTEIVCDNDISSCKTLKLNISKHAKSGSKPTIINQDIAETSFIDLEDKIDLLSGGPPCQPFSAAGLHNANKDRRNMFPEAIRAVREIRPKAFIFENVAGLTRPKFRDYFEYIRLQLCHPELQLKVDESWSSHLRRLEDHHLSGNRGGLNFRLVVHSLNAADYGVPQQRNRVFFIGFQENAGIPWHFPHPTHSKQALLRQMSSGEYWDRNTITTSTRVRFEQALELELTYDQPPTEPWRTLREAITDLPEAGGRPENMTVDDPMHVFRPGARAYKGHTGSILDQPAKTIKAGVHGVPGGENMFTDDYGELRYFTLRECARIQTFPDSYHFEGSWSAAVKQIGNAVPVDVAEIVSKSVGQALLAKIA